MIGAPVVFNPDFTAPPFRGLRGEVVSIDLNRNGSGHAVVKWTKDDQEFRVDHRCGDLVVLDDEK